jgi:hypothetical protein
LPEIDIRIAIATGDVVLGSNTGRPRRERCGGLICRKVRKTRQPWVGVKQWFGVTGPSPTLGDPGRSRPFSAIQVPLGMGLPAPKPPMGVYEHQQRASDHIDLTGTQSNID